MCLLHSTQPLDIREVWLVVWLTHYSAFGKYSGLILKMYLSIYTVTMTVNRFLDILNGYLNYIIIQTLGIKLKCILFPLIILCFHNLIVVHLWEIQLIGYGLERHTHLSM
jgi:hypothetical protein